MLVSGEAIVLRLNVRDFWPDLSVVYSRIFDMIEECTPQRLRERLGTATFVNVECLILSPTRACVRGDYAVIVLHVSLFHGISIHVPCIGHHTNTAGA